MCQSAETMNSAASIATPTDIISDLPVDSLSRCIDLEWESLSREGSITVMTLLVDPSKVILLIDVYNLGEITFTTPGEDGKTLKYIFRVSDRPESLLRRLTHYTLTIELSCKEFKMSSSWRTLCVWDTSLERSSSEVLQNASRRMLPYVTRNSCSGKGARMMSSKLGP